MIIQNGQVYGEDRIFRLKDLYIENGMIVSDVNEVTDRTVIDATGYYVLPGLIDIHSHGACGHDFSDADEEGMHKILRYQYTHGITTYCPTSMTLPKEQLIKAFLIAKKVKDSHSSNRKEARIAGINMEGPFLDSSKKGAHNEKYVIEPDVAFFKECNNICGELIRLVTIAPNMKGAMDFIRELSDQVVLSLGHTTADYMISKAAIELGAHHVTHLYNAMMPFAHRDTGLIGAAFENKQCMVELICDGIHIHESMIQATFKMFEDRVVLISDSIRATGLEDGVYELGGQEVTVVGKKATLKDDTIAGSVTNLYDCMCNAIAYGIKPEIAIAAATINPAKSIGIYDEAGSLSVGKRADILLVDKEFKLVKVI